VFHEGTMEIGHAVPDPEPRAGIHERFERTAERLARALRRLGVDARVGEVPGEYCPGRYSVNARGAVKLAGIGQRIVAGGSHTGVVLVVSGEERINDVLRPVYEALNLPWEPQVTGSVATESPDAGWDAVRDALLAEYALDHELVEGELDEATLALARELAPEHRA
jgi:octanoyl-[GcvH]:protein N-octanoyltransferase